MPVKVIKYTCAFKCGARANKSYNNMVGHEESCWNNPVNQTCNTCSNQTYEYNSNDDFNGRHYRGCKIAALGKVLEDRGVHRIMADQLSLHVRPVYNCPYHNKSEDQDVEIFAGELKQEILNSEENTTHYPFRNKAVNKPEIDSGDVPW